MAFYFENFPITKYSFGDQEPEVYFQKISSMVDLIDTVKQEVAYYTKYTIIDNERPDTLSYKLYGTSDYYWTFFLMNDNLRESGWPLTLDREEEVILERYPYYTMSCSSTLAGLFPIGQEVVHSSGGYSTVIKKRLDLGQVIVEPTGFENDVIGGEIVKVPSTSQADITSNMLSTGSISYNDAEGITQTAVVWQSTYEWNSAHHYEDDNGEYVDVNVLSSDRTGLKEITFKERLKAKNQELKEITVLRPGVANSIVGEFHKLIARS